MIDRDELLAILNDPTRSLDEVIRPSLVARMTDVIEEARREDQEWTDKVLYGDSSSGGRPRGVLDAGTEGESE